MPELIAVICPRCHRHLVDVPAQTWVMCPTCHRWIRAKQGHQSVNARALS